MNSNRTTKYPDGPFKRTLSDSSSIVTIVAAEAMAKYGNDGEKKEGLATLLRLADLNNSNVIASVHALAAIDRLEQKASVVSQVKNLPGKDGKTRRGGGYIPALIRSIGR